MTTPTTDEQLPEKAELWRKWAIDGMPKDKQRLADAAFEAGRESARETIAAVAAERDALRADIAALRSAGLYTANRLVEAESKLSAVGALVVEMRDNAEYVAVDPHDHFLQGSAAASEEYANKLAAIIAEAGTGEGGA